MDTIQSRLDGVDWKAYEKSILALTTAGIEAFTAAGDQKIFQVSIWTDLEARVSAINFETAAHAKEYAEAYAQRLRDEKMYARADEVLSVMRSANPANFLYKDAAECYHSELEPLRRHLGSRSRFTWADTYLSGRLLTVRNTIIESGILRKIPHEDPIWFGISSEQSWYDREEAFHL